MLRSLTTLQGSKIVAKDGELGEVRDFLFDDRTWKVRYLVVETGSWLSRRQVLVAPTVASQPELDKRVIAVDLTVDQVRHSPDVDTAQPVSRQSEIAMSQHYGWGTYWTVEPPLSPVLVADAPIEPEGDPHLRSMKEVVSYSARAAGDEVGKVDDLIIDDTRWSIRYLAVKTGSWLDGQKILLSTESVGSISWTHREVSVPASLQEV